MLFTGENDEDNFISPTSSGTKLASLFGTDLDMGSQHDNQSLVYRPPKQPSTKKKPTSTAVTQGSNSSPSQQPQRPSVIHAAVVHAYKFEEGTHVSNGNLGVAVVGNHDNHLYQLLLYRGKQEPIATANITSEFAYTVQSNNYASFYDNKRQSWSILFDTEQAAIECAKQVGLARANSGMPSLQSILSQDVAFGKGPSVNSGDTIAVKYTGFSLVNHALGPVVDETKTFVRTTLGTNEILKVLNEGLVGATRGSTRLLFVPRCLVQQTANLDLTSISAIIYMVQVAEELPVFDAVQANVDDKLTSSSKPPSATNAEETTVRARGASISEQLQLSPKTDKAKIISRMAKMGQPMLPLQGAVAARCAAKARSSAASSESEEEAVRAAAGSHSSPSPEPAVTPRPRARNQISNAKRAWEFQQQQQQQLEQLGGGAHIHQLPATYGMAARSQILPLSTTGVNPYMILPSQAYVGSPGDTHVPVLLSEMRSQTTELRLQMVHMSEKVDQVLGKLEHASHKPSYPTMEVDILAHNIQRIVKENEEMRVELKDKNQKLENQTLMINELLQRNQKFLEQSNSMWEQRNTYLESSTVNNRLNSTMEQELEQARSAQAQLEAQLAAIREEEEQKQTSEKRRVILDEKSVQSEPIGPSDEELHLKNTLAEANRELAFKDDRSARLEADLVTLQTELDHLKRELHESKQEYEDSLKKLEALRSSESHRDTSSLMLTDEIKKIMNAVYRNLNTNFLAGEKYGGKEIKEILASTIRAITLELTDRFAKAEKPDSSDTEVEGRRQDEMEKVKSVQKSTEDEVTTESNDWKPQPPPFSEGDNEDDEQDWLS